MTDSNFSLNLPLSRLCMLRSGSFSSPGNSTQSNCVPSEALNILICYTAGAPWGLFVGCILTNLTSPFGLVDIVFGSLATLSSALIGRRIKNRYLAMLPSVVINGLVVAAVICAASDTWPVYAATALSVALSQAFSIYAIGIPLMLLIERSARLKEIIKD